MPHIIVKLMPGRSEQQKQQLADAITRDVMDILGAAEESVSVGFEEVAAAEWTNEVYRPDIENKWASIYKKPGYEPF